MHGPMERDTKRLERRAKSLLLYKDIPPGKMEIVRALMNNKELLPEERYSAIIELIKTCPDKKPKTQKNVRIEVAESGVPRTHAAAPEREQEKKPHAPEERSIHVNHLHQKYMRLKIFKKRYLIHAGNRLGIGIKKRLIPSPRLMKALREVVGFKEKILARLPEVLLEILRDQSLDDPTLFNYLRVFRTWMMETPLIEYRYDSLKWMERATFESELKDFVVFFLSFQKLDVETRERLILLVEEKLRLIPELAKEIINQNDSEHVRNEKEKQNLAREKLVFEFMMIMRSFLPASMKADSVVSEHLRKNYGIPSYPQLLLILMECLVFWREIDFRELERYYEVRPPSVSRSEWDFNIDELKRHGKDPESRKKKKRERIRELLAPYEELYSLLDMKVEGRDVLAGAMEEQSRHLDKRQRDFEEVLEGDFLSFLDGCVNYFNNCFVPLLDGSTVYFENENRVQIEGSLFTPSFFQEDLTGLARLVSELYFFRSNNPSLILSRDEVRQIMKGKMRSLSQVERLVGSIGSLFYDIGAAMHRLLGLHRLALRTVSSSKREERTPLQRGVLAATSGTGLSIPFADFRISGFERARPLSKLLIGKSVLGEPSHGAVIAVIAFSYQLAFECMNEQIYRDLDERKKLLQELREASG